jgi:hypothetical protein
VLVSATPVVPSTTPLDPGDGPLLLPTVAASAPLVSPGVAASVPHATAARTKAPARRTATDALTRIIPAAR